MKVNTPWKVNAQKPPNDAQEINFAAIREKPAKQSFNSRFFQEVDKVIDVKTKNEKRCWHCTWLFIWIPNETWVKTGVLEGETETDGLKIALILSYQYSGLCWRVWSTKKKPVFPRIRLRVTRWRADKGYLLRWKKILAKGILTVTLTKWAMLFNCKTDKKLKWVTTKVRSKLITF